MGALLGPVEKAAINRRKIVFRARMRWKNGYNFSRWRQWECKFWPGSDSDELASTVGSSVSISSSHTFRISNLFSENSWGLLSSTRFFFLLGAGCFKGKEERFGIFFFKDLVSIIGIYGDKIWKRNGLFQRKCEQKLGETRWLWVRQHTKGHLGSCQ